MAGGSTRRHRPHVARVGASSAPPSSTASRRPCDDAPDLPNLLLAPYFRDAIAGAQSAWRRVVATAVTGRGRSPAAPRSPVMAWYDGYRSERLPANLIQAQRDYFGAHTYERVDRPRGERFHTDWTGVGETVSTSYDA